MDFMTSKGNAQHRAAARTSAPAAALEEGEREGGAVAGEEVMAGDAGIREMSHGMTMNRYCSNRECGYMNSGREQRVTTGRAQRLGWQRRSKPARLASS